MGVCCCSARKPHLHGTPVYYYCPPSLEERESLASNDGIASSFTTGLLVGLNLETSTPDTYQPPLAPLLYDMVLGGPTLIDSKSGRETVSGATVGVKVAYIFDGIPNCRRNGISIRHRNGSVDKEDEFRIWMIHESVAENCESLRSRSSSICPKVCSRRDKVRENTEHNRPNDPCCEKSTWYWPHCPSDWNSLKS